MLLSHTVTPEADSERVLVVDNAGRVRGVYNGMLALDMENPQADMDVLLHR